MNFNFSGVATYCRENATPSKAEEGITGKLNSVTNRIEFCENIESGFTDSELKELDSEGRCVMTLHQFKVNTNSIFFHCKNFDYLIFLKTGIIYSSHLQCLLSPWWRKSRETRFQTKILHSPGASLSRHD